MFSPAQEAPSGIGAAIASPPPRGDASSAVGVHLLTLTAFRNYRSARLAVGTGPVVLTGPNGAGKTNLLEALSFLAPGRGLRGARLSDIDHREPGGRESGRGEPAETSVVSDLGWAVSAVIATRRGELRIGTGRVVVGEGRNGSGERRVVRIDGETARGQTALGERLGIVWLTPLMDRLFLDGPGERRRFLDRLVLSLDPAHAGRVAAYEQALRERSHLLRDAAAASAPADPAWLGALEEVMAEKGVAIAAARREVVQRLDLTCNETAGPFPRARLALTGTVEGWLDERPALAAEEQLKAALAGCRRDDAATGGAGIGPHRSDLSVTHAEKGMPAERASTGEQKALLIAILLAHARLQRATRGEPPLLLLDEVAAHLDGSRREALFDALLALDGQAWLTGTDAAMFAPLRTSARFLSVADGTVSEAAP